MTYNDFYITHDGAIPWGDGFKMDDDVSSVFDYYKDFMGKMWLDVGCGFSPFLPYVEKHPQIQYTGIDIAETVLKKNTLKYANVSNIHFAHSGAYEYLSSNVGKYSCIFDIGCLHCVQSELQDQILKIYHTSIENDGYLFLRFFEGNSGGSPLFFIDKNLPIWGVKKEKIFSYFRNHYTLCEEVIDASQFDIAKRITLLFCRNK